MTSELHPEDDLLLGLALDDVPDSDREAALRHLSGCRRCRDTYDAISATMEQTLAAAPSVEPPPGFDARVLTAMGFDADRWSRGRRRRIWTRGRLVAASVVAGLGLGIGATLGIQQAGGGDDAPALAEGSAYLETGDGDRVGTVTPSYVDGDRVLVVSVTSGRVGMRYLCLLRLDNGKQVPTEDWVLESERGATWVVKYPEAPVTEVELVANGGAGPVWSTADL